MLKRQRTLTPPPSELHSFDYGFGLGMGSSSSGVDEDYIDATGFGHIAKRRRVTAPLPFRHLRGRQNPPQSYGGSDQDESATDDDKGGPHVPAPAPTPSNLPKDSAYHDTNDLLRRLHLEHTRRNYLQSLALNGKPTSDATRDWDTKLFDIAKYHAHNTISHPPAQTSLCRNKHLQSHQTQHLQMEDEAISVLSQYRERNRLLGDAVRMRMRGQNDKPGPS